MHRGRHRHRRAATTDLHRRRRCWRRWRWRWHWRSCRGVPVPVLVPVRLQAARVAELAALELHRQRSAQRCAARSAQLAAINRRNPKRADQILSATIRHGGFTRLKLSEALLGRHDCAPAPRPPWLPRKFPAKTPSQAHTVTKATKTMMPTTTRRKFSNLRSVEVITRRMFSKHTRESGDFGVHCRHDCGEFPLVLVESMPPRGKSPARGAKSLLEAADLAKASPARAKSPAKAKSPARAP